MKLHFMVSPGYPPARFAGWHMLNSLLQSRTRLPLQLHLPAMAAEQARLLRDGMADLIYANPFDAVTLIRDQHYRPVARPLGKPDEVVIAAAAESSLLRLQDLRAGHRIAITDGRDVRLVGLRLLEAADLEEADLQWVACDTFQACARLLLSAEVQAAFFVADTYHAMSRLTSSRLRVLVESAMDDLNHVLLVHPRAQASAAAVLSALTGIDRHTSDQQVLDALGVPYGFAPMSAEEGAQLLDLMDALVV